jgi:2-polyprenyl-6-methoxyphenol hydroxylase-like FAD-dependent oxidoreductase
MIHVYDVIIVGARCAGAPTALLLARQGIRVLLADRVVFPSDTVSTHLLHPAGVAHLRGWGLLDALLASGCPRIESIAFQPAPGLTLRAAPYPAADGSTLVLAPRRTKLDLLLVEAATAAGATVREGVSFQRPVWQDGRVVGAEFRDRDGRTFTEQGALLVGADGRHSEVAKAVEAQVIRDAGNFGCQYYGYWTGLPDKGAQVFVGQGKAVLAFPTHDGNHLVLVGWPRERFEEVKRDLDGNFLAEVEVLAPEIRGYLTEQNRTARIVGSGDMANRIRTSAGPGWVLAGDAAVAKDAVTAQGIGDAFAQAQSLADLLPEALAAGPQAVDEATAAHIARRDREGAAGFETTLAFATGGGGDALGPIFHAIKDRPELISMFFGVYAGRVPLGEFAAAVGAASDPPLKS